MDVGLSELRKLVFDLRKTGKIPDGIYSYANEERVIMRNFVLILIFFVRHIYNFQGHRTCRF